MLYYPYNFMRLCDYNGSSTELRYELMGGTNIDVFYTPSPSCKAFVAPRTYMGKEGFDVGFVTDCGGLGSWVNDAYKNWLAQNSGTSMLTIAGVALAGAAGMTGIAAANSALSAGARTVAGGTAYTGASLAAAESSYVKGAAALGLGAQQAAGLGAQAINASHQPSLTRGQADLNLMFTTGLQGVYAERVCVRAEIAKQIDEFFDRWGYEVDRVKPVDITSRPSWNYVKTQGAAPRSANVAAGTSAPFSRGRGTPAEALDIIRSRFDAGVTFWHTTSGFGDFSLGNGVS